MSPEKIDDMFGDLAELVAKHGITVTITIYSTPSESWATADATTERPTA